MQSLKVPVSNTTPAPLISVVQPQYRRGNVPLIVKFNRLLRTTLVTLCGIALLGYGLDVAADYDVSKLRDQARRINEQNTELSAQLLRVISFQGIQDSVLGHCGLRIPEKVLVVHEIQPVSIAPFQEHKHNLPLIAGY